MTELRFDGRVAIITGAGRGLGRAYAVLLAARGARVVVNDVGHAAEATASVIRSAGGDAVANLDPVGSRAAAEALVSQAMDHYGRLDVVVNNAGIALNRPFGECTETDLERLMQVHYFGTAHVARAAWPVMSRAGYGRIVNTISSFVYGFAGWSAYGAAKGAILGLTRSIAIEGRPLGIGVNAVAPGAGTAMTESSGVDPAIVEMLRRTMPPEAVAPIVAFLAHESCTLHGEVISAAGGTARRLQIGETDGIAMRGTTPEEVGDRLGEILDPSSFHAFTSADDSLSRARERFR